MYITQYGITRTMWYYKAMVDVHGGLLTRKQMCGGKDKHVGRFVKHCLVIMKICMNKRFIINLPSKNDIFKFYSQLQTIHATLMSNILLEF